MFKSIVILWGIIAKMNILVLLLTLSFVPVSSLFAQDSGQTLSDSGVLVSSSAPGSQPSQQNDSNNENADAAASTDQHKTDADAPNTSTDPIIIKATGMMMFQITANMKLSPEQVRSIQSIVMRYIIKIRDLQQRLEKGELDGKTMYGQREQLYKDEDRELGQILTTEQMNIWANIQNR